MFRGNDLNDSLSSTGSPNSRLGSTGDAFDEITTDFLRTPTKLGTLDESLDDEGLDELVSDALRLRRDAMIYTGAFSSSDDEEISINVDHDMFRATCFEANNKLQSARSMVSASTLSPSKKSMIESYLVFHMFYNAALPLNNPPSDTPCDFGATFGGISTLEDQVKSYKFENFYKNKEGDNIDYFLCGAWVSVALLHYERTDLLKKYRGKLIPSFQKLGVASHFDYEQVWLECMLISFCPLQTIVCVGEEALGGQVLQSMGFSWDCMDFSDTFDIIARGNSVSFLDLFSKESFVLMVNLLLVLCDLAPEEVRRSQSWIPSKNTILKMNTEQVFKTGLSVLDLSCLVCLVYEKFGRHKDAEKLATEALKTASKTIPRITLHYVLGRCYGRSGEDDREGREHFTNGMALATRTDLPYLVKMGQKQEEKWFGRGASEAKTGGKLW
ncbi:hypothetical protein TrCOL_g1363 [Triparma columacea]|uniref:Uncharacterized protein n=1 Tax=Triparma columacea TaxID=722753 RepID=A0A9W7G6P2_9STRA|nr:hypothetical protein TrCOL_g1363 [Triparma columacea]